MSSPKRTRYDEYQTDEFFIKKLTETNIMTMRPENNITFIAERDDKIIDVWNGLNRHNFMSVPVIQRKKEKYFGFIDLADIVGHFVNVWGENALKKTPNLRKLTEEDDDFRKKTVVDLMIHPLSKRNPFIPVRRDYSLYFAFELLAREEHMHRIPVINNEKVLVNLISQTQLVEYINENIQKVGTISAKPVKLFKDSMKKVYTIPENKLAMEAFVRMKTHNVTGIAVVNNKHEITGVLTLKDLKIIANDDKLFQKLYLNVTNFIKELEKKDKKRPRSPVVCDGKTTLEEVVKTLCDKHVHRLFITNEENKPIGVVGLKEVLYEIISE
eukprot:gene12638-6542_t